MWTGGRELLPGLTPPPAAAPGGGSKAGSDVDAALFVGCEFAGMSNTLLCMVRCCPGASPRASLFQEVGRVPRRQYVFSGSVRRESPSGPGSEPVPGAPARLYGAPWSASRIVAPSELRRGGLLSDVTGEKAIPSGVLLLEAMNRLRSAEVLLQTRARARLGLRANDFQTVQFLAAQETAGLRARARDLPDLLGVTAPAASMIVDRLVARGLAHRAPDPDDGRSQLLRLTAEAQQGLAAVYGDLPRAIQDLLDEVPDYQARSLIDLAMKVQRLVDVAP